MRSLDKLNRRRFLKHAALTSAAFSLPSSLFSSLFGQGASAETKPVSKILLPWERELPLREAAWTAGIKRLLTTVAPMSGAGGRGSGALQVGNPAMRAAIWGTPGRITVSLQKNDVWDRRLRRASIENAPTLQEIIEGTNSPANKNFWDVQPGSTRPKWGYLLKEGGKLNPYPTWKKPEGLVFAGISGVEPWRGAGEHPWDIGSYPTVLSDDINLDSDREARETMLRTVRLLRARLSGRTAILLGSTLGGDGNDHGGGRGEREPERLLNSRSGRIHLFPCVEESESVAFRHFQARGGFLVSACRDAGGVTFVEIESRRRMICRVMNPWLGKAVVIEEGKTRRKIQLVVDHSNGECLTFDARVGGRYQITPV